MKNQWFDTWVRGGALRERTSPKGVPRELDSIHHYLRAVRTKTLIRIITSRLISIAVRDALMGSPTSQGCRLSSRRFFDLR